MPHPLTIFYDASCSLCVSEMHALRLLAGEDRIRLIDCSASGFDASALGRDDITRDALMARIHARDGDGRWLVGIDVYEAAYRAAGLERLARLWGHRRLRPLWTALYPLIADNRRLLSRLGASGLARRLIPGRACTACAKRPAAS